jgi:hypothetical protein
MHVKIIFEQAEIDFEADTVGGLKDAIENDEDFADFEHIKKWKLYWLGSLLGDPKPDLKDLLVEEDEELRINLVPPTEGPRIDGKQRSISSDKDRLIVVGSSKSFKVLALTPQKLENATEFHKLPQEYFFLGKQKFGIITNMATDESNIRLIECAMYEVNEEGYIVMQTNDKNEDAKVFLVKDVKMRPYNARELIPRDKPKVYRENNLQGTKKGKIPEHFQMLLDEIKQTI